MRIIDRETVLSNQSATKTVQNFGKLLHDKPHKLGQVATMKPELSVSLLTDGLRNVYENSKSAKSQYTPVNAMAIEWEIDVNFVKKVKISGAVSGAGTGGTPVTIQLAERYYDKNDTFALENRQQLFVLKAPKRKSSNKWEYTVTLIGNNPARSIDPAYAAQNRITRYRSNFFPELSERGFTKYMSNMEKHRNYLSRHRASVDWSADFAIREEVYIADGKKGKETFYKMNKKEKEALDHYMFSRENNILFGESNFDINGKCNLQDEKGRDIPMGDGLITQLTKVCDKALFSKLTTRHFEDGMQTLTKKSEKLIGNTFYLVANTIFWTQFNRLMKEDLRFQNTDGAYFWSKSAGDVSVGSTFTSYEFAGNKFVVMVDRALTQEYEDRGYAILLDGSKDPVSGRPNLAMFTMEGSELVSGNLNGLGGQSGKSSGEISTSIHGSSYHLIGYSGVVVFNPYKAFIFEQNVA